MRTYARLGLLAVLGVGLAVALTVVASGLFASGDRARASLGITIGLDMDPYGAPANVCPGDGVTDCTVGTIEQCKPVPNVAGATFDIDALVTGLWNGHSAWSWDLAFPDNASGAKLSMTGQVELNPVVNLVMQSPGSAPISLSGGVPDAISPHTGAVADLGAAETTPPFTQGVLSRMTFTVGAGAAAGIYGFSFVPGTYLVVDQFGAGYPAYTVLDGNSGYGQVAVGVPCPQAADLKKVDLFADLANNIKIPVSENVRFTLTEVLHNNGPNPNVLGNVITTCQAPATTPPSHCSYTPKAGDSPGGQLEVMGPTIGTKRVPQDIPWGTKIEDTLLVVSQQVLLPMSAEVALDKDWDVHCGTPGTHTWQFDNTVLPLGTTDPVPGNNSRSLDLTLRCVKQPFTYPIKENNTVDASIGITYTPGEEASDCTKICLIQVVRRADQTNKTLKPTDFTNFADAAKKAADQTAAGYRVDYNDDEKDPCYNGDDTGIDIGTQGSKAGTATTPSKMNDSPKADPANWPTGVTELTMEFEVAAFCVEGDDKGEYFGWMKWKWHRVDGDPPTITAPTETGIGTPSQNFFDAVKKWLEKAGRQLDP